MERMFRNTNEYFDLAGRVLKGMPGVFSKLMGEAGRPEVPVEVLQAAKNPANRFGKFIRVSVIARGGGGEVYRAWDEPLARWVALKFPYLDLEQDRLRFLREANMSAGLSHANIVSVYEVVDDPKGLFIVLQLIEGRSLAGVRPKLREAVEAVKQATDAVTYAHQHGVIHRDLKPHNVMMDDEGQIYILDFGLAKWLEPGSSLTPGESVLGTPAYMSPEQASGRRADERSDVYGLGATLYELVTGRPPFEGRTAAEILKRVLEEEPIAPGRLNRRVPRDLETVIQKAMCKEAKRRYASAKEFGEDLQRYLDGEVVLARPPSFTYRISRRFKRNRVASILTIALAVVLLLAPLAILFQMAVSDHHAKGIKLGESAWQQYLALNYEEAERRAHKAIEEYKDIPISYFCKGRCSLREYLSKRPLPSAWIYEGTIVFDPVQGPSDPRLEELREEARELFRVMETKKGEGLHEWQLDCARGIELLLDGDYAEAEKLLTRAIAGGNADPEVRYYLSQAQYYQQKFAEGIRTIFGTVQTGAIHTEVKGLRQLGFWPPDVDLASARMSQALGLSRELHGKDPTPEFKRAIGILDNAIFLYPETVAAKAMLLVNWGRYLMSRGRPEEARLKISQAVNECEKASERNPVVLEANGEALVAFGDLHDARGHGGKAIEGYLGAIARFEEAIELSGGFARASAKKGRALSKLAAYFERQKQTVEARKWSVEGLKAYEVAFGELRGQADPHPDILIDLILLRGALQILEDKPRNGVFDRVISGLDEVVKKHPVHSRAVLARGIERGRYALALRYLDPQRAERLYLDAKDDCDQAIKFNPEWAEAFNCRGWIWMSLGLHRGRAGLEPNNEFACALKDINTAVLKNKFESTYLLRRAELWMRMADQATSKGKITSIFHWIARAECEEAIRINKESPKAFLLLGVSCTSLGDGLATDHPIEAELLYKDAQGSLDIAIRLAPEYGEAYYRRGNAWFNYAYAVLKDSSEKEAAYREAIKDYSSCIDKKWRMRETECYMSRGRASLQVGFFRESSNDRVQAAQYYTESLSDLMAAVSHNLTLEPRLAPLIRQAREGILRQDDF